MQMFLLKIVLIYAKKLFWGHRAFDFSGFGRHSEEIMVF
jgi:hypothetical protein